MGIETSIIGIFKIAGFILVTIIVFLIIRKFSDRRTR